VDGKLIYSRAKTGVFPDEGKLVEMLLEMRGGDWVV
jgi:hypothetical protein